MRQWENEQGLYFNDESGSALVQLGSGKTESAGILFASSDGKSMSRLQVDGAGFPRLEPIRASQKAASWHKAGEAEDGSEWTKLEVGRDGNVQLEPKEMLKRKVVRPEE